MRFPVPSIRRLLLAGLVALVAAGAGVSPAAASETDSETITTVLSPGWNLVGWVGPNTPTSELFDDIPVLRQVWAWDAEEQTYLRAWRDSYHELSSLTTGIGLWLRLGGISTFEWTREVSDEGVLLTLHTGRNLVGWTGNASSPVAMELARMGDKLVEAWRWDAQARRFVLYNRAAETSNQFGALRTGGALWVELVEGARWWQSGAARAEFEFSEGISPEVRSDVRTEMGTVVAFFAERWGAQLPELTVSVSDTQPGCWATPHFMQTTVPFWCAAHEYFHVLQYALAGASPWGPIWLAEGSATYAEELYDGGLEFRRWVAPARASHVGSIRYPELANPGGLRYHLGFLAADWLVDHAGEASLLDYYRLLPSADGWEDAFAEAFGLTIEEFYVAFEDYRAEVAPPLPHLAEDAVRPVAVFLGGVRLDVQEAIQAEMDSVHAFIVERFGAEPSEYSVYVGATWDAVSDHAQRLGRNRWWDDRVRSHSLPLPWEYGCSIGVTSWIVHAVDCGRSLDHLAHINSHIRVLLEDRDQLDPQPLWIEAGGGRYIDLAYRSAYDDEIGRYIRTAAQSPVPLRQLETTESWAAIDGEEKWALSILAVDWLLSRSGEPALFDYYRLLPHDIAGLPRAQRTSAAAFEQAFGLTIEEFYEQFEAYRATLTAE